jgi:hypothetical protein
MRDSFTGGALAIVSWSQSPLLGISDSTRCRCSILILLCSRDAFRAASLLKRNGFRSIASYPTQQSIPEIVDDGVYHETLGHHIRIHAFKKSTPEVRSRLHART